MNDSISKIFWRLRFVFRLRCLLRPCSISFKFCWILSLAGLENAGANWRDADIEDLADRVFIYWHEKAPVNDKESTRFP